MKENHYGQGRSHQLRLRRLSAHRCSGAWANQQHCFEKEVTVQVFVVEGSAATAADARFDGG